ncbi:DUF885 domain-containing protein [Corynebacterium uberis]|uniref:DUF885 domain-containing protein n=1 Tax=Corynebacterium TaxID=1716 RepID=UPI001D0AAACA|nr:MULTISPECIES: DUF885 domain-containing protein [Corynebacterium]MCZ9309845.1 DUF885 domain-containing protein [Corynebacterium sp. c6VSa_13]UDL73228.1 DUF885 domain-containing protein [Corynebacterium uberis]UDL75895.1 DUF885 domain-containing protein [Corynebacterium uberis]UDL78107.1 DUF885 domain-containing protein [Corynebacterium uberis]UDL80390.1 DUF885 domain-containing protein [Corynebacterium uberis]
MTSFDSDSADQHSHRAQSLLDAACEAYVADLAALCPTAATAWGIPGHEGELEDFSPDHFAAVAERTREMVMDVDAFDEGTDACDDEDDFDAVDHVTAAALRDRLCLDLDLHHSGEDLRNLNNIDSPVQTIRDTFLLMGQDTDEQREAIRSRLDQVPAALAGYRDSLSQAAAGGKVAAIRQVSAVVAQCEDLAREGSMLENLGLDADNPQVGAAKVAFGQMADWLTDQLASHAPECDAVGRERYELFSHLHVGDVVDLDEAYEWGLERLADIRARQQDIAHHLYGPETSTRQAFHLLNHDERYLVTGTDALTEFMATTTARAMNALAGTHFDIPERVRAIECRIDPAGTGGIFYTPPSDDLTRPGTMWWSVPEGQTTFHTWQERTTVHHEGVPGHHLQCATALLDADALNTWRRAVCWISGHGEGWALYAEQLMADLGLMDDPADLMGLYDAQRLRAARVVLDIGVHLGKKVPEGTGVWDGAYAKSFLRDNSALDEANLAFELDRYLGWPGQAPSYALGQRAWEDTRDAALEQGLSLREFHSQALALGSVPMSVLRSEVLD